MQSRTVRRVIVALATLTMVAGTAIAGENIFRFGGATVHPTGDLTLKEEETIFIPPDPLPQTLVTTERIDAEGNAGLVVSYERRIGDTVGMEFGVGRSEHNVDFRTIEEIFNSAGAFGGKVLDESLPGGIDMLPVSAALNIYLDTRENMDFYLGGFIGYVFYGDLEVPMQDTNGVAKAASVSTMKLNVADDFSFGAVAGLGFAVGENWTFRTSVRYLKTSAEATFEDEGVMRRAELPIDPISAEFAFGVQF